uniref:Secreted protein n=1 Tax=Mesocestoides corti TaxID=53468 RepID=A0A5K3FKP5_MESCO
MAARRLINCFTSFVTRALAHTHTHTIATAAQASAQENTCLTERQTARIFRATELRVLTMNDDDDNDDDARRLQACASSRTRARAHMHDGSLTRSVRARGVRSCAQPNGTSNGSAAAAADPAVVAQKN